MYFVRFSKRNMSLDEPIGCKITCMDFNSRIEALTWLFDNGYVADGLPPNVSKYNANMFWHPEEKISATGFSY